MLQIVSCRPPAPSAHPWPLACICTARACQLSQKACHAYKALGLKRLTMRRKMRIITRCKGQCIWRSVLFPGRGWPRSLKHTQASSCSRRAPILHTELPDADFSVELQVPAHVLHCLEKNLHTPRGTVLWHTRWFPEPCRAVGGESEHFFSHCAPSLSPRSFSCTLRPCRERRPCSSEWLHVATGIQARWVVGDRSERKTYCSQPSSRQTAGRQTSVCMSTVDTQNAVPTVQNVMSRLCTALGIAPASKSRSSVDTVDCTLWPWLRLWRR